MNPNAFTSQTAEKPRLGVAHYLLAASPIVINAIMTSSDVFRYQPLVRTFAIASGVVAGGMVLWLSYRAPNRPGFAMCGIMAALGVTRLCVVIMLSDNTRFDFRSMSGRLSSGDALTRCLLYVVLSIGAALFEVYLRDPLTRIANCPAGVRARVALSYLIYSYWCAFLIVCILPSGVWSTFRDSAAKVLVESVLVTLLLASVPVMLLDAWSLRHIAPVLARNAIALTVVVLLLAFLAMPSMAE